MGVLHCRHPTGLHMGHFSLLLQLLCSSDITGTSSGRSCASAHRSAMAAVLLPSRTKHILFRVHQVRLLPEHLPLLGSIAVTSWITKLLSKLVFVKARACLHYSFVPADHALQCPRCRGQTEQPRSLRTMFNS